MAFKKLSILFLKDGFSFCVLKGAEIAHAEKISIDVTQNSTYYETLSQKLNQQLYLSQSYDEINIACLTEQFNLVPTTYFEQDQDAQKWLEFNAEVFENDSIETADLTALDAKIIYAYPIELKQLIENKFNVTEIRSGSAIFINSFNIEVDEPQVFLNLHPKQLEILVFKNKQLFFYNIFEVDSKEDFVYYVLNCLRQLELDPNQVFVYYFGLEIEEKTLKMLMNFVRHVMPGTSNLTELSYYSEIKNIS